MTECPACGHHDRWPSQARFHLTRCESRHRWPLLLPLTDYNAACPFEAMLAAFRVQLTADELERYREVVKGRQR